MELLGNLALGFGEVLTVSNLLHAFVGCLLGTLIGVLPGLGPSATIAMLLPITFALEPTSALIMLAGIYYGAQYGGSTTAILVNLPGEPSSVVTCLDGYRMARNGRGGAALSIAAVGSFFAGCVATLLLACVAKSMAELAIVFGPAEYFSLMLLGLIGAVVLAHGSVPKAVAMIVLGLLLGLVGIDVNTGLPRFTFGFPELTDGIGAAIVAMGLFGIAEILVNLEREQVRTVLGQEIRSLMPTREERRRAIPAVLRGTVIGSALGILPGGGAMLSSFAAYGLEKKVSAHPERFGTGMVEGVAGPEAANNAAAQTSFIPLLTLGIPPNAVMALMVGAMMIHSIQPGPQVMVSNPALFWGLIASMWIGNLMLVILNLPLIAIWVKLLTVPYRLLYPAILLFSCIGVFSLNSSAFDVFTMIAFGAMGYVFLKLDCEPAPLIMGYVLGPLMEENFRRALLLSRGDPTVFLTSPISAGLLAVTTLLFASLLLPSFQRQRRNLFAEDG